MNCCVASVIHKEPIKILMIASLIDSQLNIPMIKQRSCGQYFVFRAMEQSYPFICLVHLTIVTSKTGEAKDRACFYSLS